MKLSRPQHRMLEDIRDHKDPWRRIRGASQHGGSLQTVRSLVRYGLATATLKATRRGVLYETYRITRAGRAVLKEKA